MKINNTPEISEISRAAFIHMFDCLDKYFRHANGKKGFEVKTLDLSKRDNNSLGKDPSKCYFKVAHSLRDNYLITMWYMGVEAVAVTSATEASNESIVRFLRRFPDVEEVSSN